MWEQLLHFIGADDTAGVWYGFWSGFGGIMERLIELAVIAVILLRHKNCHEHGCPRIGKYPVEGTPYVVCKKHHPDIPEGPVRVSDA